MIDDWGKQNGVLLLGKTEAAWARMQVLQPTPNGGRIAIANNYVGVMNDNLRTNPGLGVNIEISNGAELLQHIDIFLNKIIKVE